MSDEGFESLFKEGEYQTPDDTAQEIQHQLREALKPGGATKAKQATTLSGEKPPKTRRRDTYTQRADSFEEA
ncbi:hypothetical protein SERLA73DRAFT_73786 [Serpula lacrymans var. lacrymans S7.3]|uniref:Uncharacterized protein n=2 Tax=Serpula lacrymans var. lacrymans TaxID=341189 RepID=F8PWS0_SERL3|nr:uncharacterized protein SERLADRAFT_438417 [Serpula lacrymans var. lacrymans S7.9]EGN99247.1 hypothetical protein SERLA73DRAFT_73786 [Serpula lacrymans var. lacrymans S7.3]EGO24814.1 hypothetical protein SERLADRAFT_438417 [Serpula lacrymans var. lacrymans S7.9]